MKPESLLGHTAQLYRRVKRNPLQADQTVESFLRARKYLGSRDRQFIAELLYFLLRNYRWITTAFYTAVEDEELGWMLRDTVALTAKAKVSVEELLIVAAAYGLKMDTLPDWLPAFLALHTARSATEMAAFLDQVRTVAKATLDGDEDLETIGVRYSIAPWILSRWLEHGYSLEDIRQLAAALTQPAPVCIRANTLKIDRSKLQEHLAAEQWEFSPTRWSPHGLCTPHRLQLLAHPLYQEGYFELQDEGSQLISFAVAPQPHWSILDACAGAGGKSLHLAALQEDRGKILATDIEPKRLKALRKRTHRAGIRSIQTLTLPNSTSFHPTLPHPLRPFAQSFDAVLVDAPCSATGRSRRSPATRWYTKETTVAKLARQQLHILQLYAQCVAPGGILVYATCSLLPQENELVVEQFLREHPEFEPDPLLPAFETYHIRLPLLQPDQWHYTMLPSVMGTDGFFVARMRRVR